MAPGRLYRDYSSEQASFEVPPRRTSSIRKAWDEPGSPETKKASDRPGTPETVQLDGAGSPRTIISESKPYEYSKSDEYAKPYENSKPDEYSKLDDTSSINDYGIALSTDDRNDTPQGNGSRSPRSHRSPEPILHEAQVDLHSLHSGTQSPGPAIPADIRSGGFAPSITSDSMSGVSHYARSNNGGVSASKMPEFFSQAVFQTVLHNPTISHQLLKFGQQRLCGENMEFLQRVNRYHALLHEVSKAVAEIHKEFISNNAQSQINLPEHLLVKANAEMKATLKSTLPMLESVFVPSQADIERLVYTDIYPRFVRHQMSVSAAKALGGDRGKYAGLGDCFVLTDPAKADNPIVYASDGFVKVTGYSRNEIIPRNCRFLQGAHTDQSAVRRLKYAIDKRQDSVELLLNQKKNGEPFWNLLYMTPLYDGNGKLVFFLGGQINCSTTIHSASDVLRILAQSKDTDEDAAAQVQTLQPIKPPRARSILSAFRSNSRASIPQRAPGMENKLLDKLEEMPLKSQMNTFYTAYSNVSHFSVRIAWDRSVADTAAVYYSQLQQLPHHLRLRRYH